MADHSELIAKLKAGVRYAGTKNGVKTFHIKEADATMKAAAEVLRTADAAGTAIPDLLRRLLWPHNPASEETIVPIWCIELFAEAASAISSLLVQYAALEKAHDTVCGHLAAAISRAEKAEAALSAGLDACDQFDSPVSSSAFVNGQATCAQQIRAKLKGDV